MTDVWSFLSVADRPHHATSDGYDDLVGRHYSWDSTVANRHGPRVGDMALVRNRTAVLGLGTIERMELGRGMKRRRRCPTCDRTKIHKRATLLPRYRCQSSSSNRVVP